MWGLFKRHAQPETSMLPTEVADTIESAHLLVRSGPNDDGEQRVLVTIPGRRFYGDAESIKAAVSARWPELNPSQHSRAVSWLRSLVAARIRAEASDIGHESPRWAGWRPLEPINFGADHHGY